jgi:hypothetical protein
MAVPLAPFGYCRQAPSEPFLQQTRRTREEGPRKRHPLSSSQVIARTNEPAPPPKSKIRRWPLKSYLSDSPAAWPAKNASTPSEKICCSFGVKVEFPGHAASQPLGSPQASSSGGNSGDSKTARSAHVLRPPTAKMLLSIVIVVVRVTVAHREAQCRHRIHNDARGPRRQVKISRYFSERLLSLRERFEDTQLRSDKQKLGSHKTCRSIEDYLGIGGFSGSNPLSLSIQKAPPGKTKSASRTK